MLIGPDFFLIKQFFFFMWLLVCKLPIISFFLCSYVVKTLSSCLFSTLLAYVFVGYITFFFFFSSVESTARRDFLFLRVLRWVLSGINFNFLYHFVSQFISFNFSRVYWIFQSFFLLLKKGSKKEFNSEKINTYLLRKKKQENFLKKFYRSNS